jgi:putative CocE/NonD family hydrolase
MKVDVSDCCRSGVERMKMTGNRLVIILVAAFVMAVVVMVAAPGIAAETYGVVFERNVKVVMRDGVVLRADIYRPQAEGKFPVLLQRTPYDRRNFEFGLKGAQRGFVMIIQDVRGRYASEGEFYTFVNESNDGYDTVEWAATLPYSNGKVGMFGGSYVGATQMLAAIAHPPHLAGICPVVTSSNYHDSWTYQGGAFEQWFNESWGSGLAQDTLNRKVAKGTNAVNGMWKLPLASYPLLPVSESDGNSAAALAPYFLDWLAHPNYDAYWKKISIEEHFGDIQAPALHIPAWYDIFLGGSLKNYMGIRDHGGSDAARKGQHLLVAIGGHSGAGRQVGDVDFGDNAAFNEDEVTLEWYEYLFKGAQNQFSGKPVKIFVLGANVWREEDDWPLARTKETKYFLHSAGKANSARGNGTLTSAAPAKESEDSYLYDPAKPVPTVGGPLCCDGQHWPPGPRDQRGVEARDDVLIFSSTPMTADMEVTGPVSLELWAKSSAADTDFTAKLVDVAPDGFAQNLTEGILRARFRDSQEAPTLLTPGQAYKLKIDLWATSNVFKKGHVIRLEVSSSNFPRFDRNLNLGTMSYGTGDTVGITATNSVLHDSEHPSVLILPVVK